ncbi:MAG: DUF4393 domain-containing protein [Pseudomonadota bacterium]
MRTVASEMWDAATIQAFVAKTVDAILKRRAVPFENVQTPRLDIAVPAFEAMRYCHLRNEIAALIAASMDNRSANDLHPSFVEILRQLTSDEVALLGTMPVGEGVVAMGHIHETLGQGRTRIIHRNVIPPRHARACQTRACIPAYIDNLLRLKLLDVPPGLEIGESAPYQAILCNKFCEPLFKGRGRQGTYRLERSLVSVTDLGQRFRLACLVS